MLGKIREIFNRTRQQTPVETTKDTQQSIETDLPPPARPAVKNLVNTIAAERDRRNEQFTKQLFEECSNAIKRLTRKLAETQADEVIFFIDLKDSKVTALALNLAVQRELTARNIKGSVVIRQYEGKTKLNFWRNPPPTS